LGAAFFVGFACGAVLLVTRPDFVFPSTTAGLASTAGAAVVVFLVRAALVLAFGRPAFLVVVAFGFATVVVAFLDRPAGFFVVVVGFFSAAGLAVACLVAAGAGFLSLTGPDGPLGRSKRPLVSPDVKARLRWLLNCASVTFPSLLLD